MPGTPHERLEFRTASVVSGRTLLACYVLFGWIPVACVREALQGGQPVDEIIQLLSVAAMAVFLLGWLTRSWLEYDRYGQSVCRVLSLPGGAGGIFGAEVECSLPVDSPHPVIVRLREQTPRGKRIDAHWCVEGSVPPDALRREHGGRVTVPVRLEVPAPPRRPATHVRHASAPQWVLEVSRRRAGVDFRAQFVIPVPEARDEAGGREVE
ncbi:MAG: hypothetical protein IT529_18695 [Burkholderiales bacterium]|nr:hypothetical protein [Burkholderiales bacterium]